jgi:hypothetical protein
MQQRGRTSAAELAVIGPKGIETIRRPEPPDELTDEQAEEWRGVVNRCPADHFPRETHSLLIQYCRLVTRARRLAQLTDKMERSKEFDQYEYTRLLLAEEHISRAIASLSGKMRLSQQSLVRYDKPRKTTTRPWE